MIYCYTKDRLWQIWILYVRNSCFNILQTCCLQNCCTLNRFFLKWKILYPKIIKAKTKHPALVHPWMHCSHSSLQTLTISNTKYAVVGHLLHSELPTIAARIFWQMQNVAMHKWSRPRLKINKLDPKCTGRSSTKFWIEAKHLCSLL